jgi:hypothetical protein
MQDAGTKSTSSAFRAAAERIATAWWTPAAIVALGLALVSPSITSGLCADDWFHRLVLTGSTVIGGVQRRAIDLFVFMNGDFAMGHAQQEWGIIGWWADPTAKIAFLRPLSSFTHWLDYRLWPDAPWLMHVQSLLWFAVGLAGMSRLYRRFAEPVPAMLALLLFAIDDAHGLPISWIANRNALITLALGVPVLVLHDRWRRDGERRLAAVAPALFAVALMGGESAAAVGGYVLAYAIFMDPAPAKGRALSVVPYAAVFVAWRAVYAALGYGTHGSALAIDPVHEPLEYAHAVSIRLPILLFAQFATVPSDVWELYPVIKPWLPALVYGGALTTLGLLLSLLWPGLRREREIRFWALGTVLATLPVCAQVPSDRLLWYPGVGAEALVARFLFAVATSEPWTSSALGRRIGGLVGALVLFVLHLVVAPIWLPARSRGAAHVTSLLSGADRSIPSDESIRKRTVVIVNPPADAFTGYIQMMRAATGRPFPERLRWLATGASAVTIERLDERTLRVEPEAGFLSLASERMQRSPKNPMLPGYTVDLAGMHVSVTRDTDDRRPKEIIARFDRPLEDPQLVFLKWNDGGYAPFVPPAVGASTTLPAVDFLSLKF